MLLGLLHIQDKSWLKEHFVQKNIHPYIDLTNKPRLIEAPSQELKLIQKQIKNYLLNCEFPHYVFSGVCGKSYIDNASYHKGQRYLFKVDISAFFPNISREKVYSFFKNDLRTSSDVAQCLTNFCTVDLEKIEKGKEDIDKFLHSKKIKHKNHLCTGSSPSPILSYLVNRLMFDEIYSLCIKKNITMTIYVDDIVFSSVSPLDSEFRKKTLNILTKNGYNISTGKMKYYMPYEVKKITGVIIRADGTLDVPNKLRLKVTRYFNDVKNGDTKKIKNLQGCVVASRQIKNVYPNILRYTKY